MAEGKPIWFSAMMDNSELRKGIAEQGKIWQQASDKLASEGPRHEKIWQRATTAAAGYLSIRQLADWGRQIVQVRGEMQGLDLAFETMLGSKAKAGKPAKKGPLETGEKVPLKTDENMPLETVENDPLKTAENDPPRR